MALVNRIMEAVQVRDVPIPATDYPLIEECLSKAVDFSMSLSWDTTVQSPIEQFVAISMCKEDGSYHTPIHLTHIVSELEYGCRLALLFHFKTRAVVIEQRYHTSIPPSIAKHLALDTLLKQTFQPVNDDSYLSPLVTLAEWKRLGLGYLASQKTPDSTYWVDSSCQQLSVGNHTLTMSALRLGIQAACEQLDQHLAVLIRGAQLPIFDPTHLNESPSNTAPGFNYIKGSQKHFSKTQNTLLSCWMASGNPHGLLVPNWQEVALLSDKVERNKIWNASASWRWLEDVDKYLELIYFVYHVACGQPARGTEESIIAYANLESTAWNLFWREKRFVVQTWYHKGLNMTGRAKPRQVWLTGHLSLHLHNYLAYIRPTQLYVCSP